MRRVLSIAYLPFVLLGMLAVLLFDLVRGARDYDWITKLYECAIVMLAAFGFVILLAWVLPIARALP